MGKMLQQAWLALTTGFMALEILMKAILHLCEWSEATAGAFKDEAADDRIAKQAERKAAMGIKPAKVSSVA